MSEEDNNITRRNVLRTVGATGAALSGASGVAAAGGNGKSNAIKQYDSVKGAKKAVVHNAKDVLKELADRDIIDRPSPNAFDLNTQISGEEMSAAANSEGRHVSNYDPQGEDVNTPHVAVSKITNEYRITLHVRPEKDTSYAIVESRIKDERFVIDPSTEKTKLSSPTGSNDGISIASSCREIRCADNTSSDVCDWGEEDELDARVWEYHYDCHDLGHRCVCYYDKRECDCSAYVMEPA